MAKRAADEAVAEDKHKAARKARSDSGHGPPDNVAEEGSSRKAKRKVAVFFGYCGSGYSGLQV